MIIITTLIVAVANYNIIELILGHRENMARISRGEDRIEGDKKDE